MKLSRWAAVAVGVAAALAVAAPAHAEDPAYEHGQPGFTAAAGENCGEVAITFNNPTPWLFVFDVRVDGEPPSHGPVENEEIAEGPLAGQKFGPRWRLVEVDGSADVHEVTVTFEFDEKVEVRLAEGGEQKLFFDWKTVDVSKVQPCPADEDGEDGRDSEENEPPTGPSESPAGEPVETGSPAPGVGGEQLPTTGSPLLPALLILGGGGLAAGFVLHRLSRSRRVTFRA